MGITNKKKIQYHMSDIKTRLDVLVGCGCTIERTVNALVYVVSHPSKKHKLELYFPMGDYQRYRKAGAKRWKKYTRGDVLIRDNYNFKLRDKVKLKYPGTLWIVGSGSSKYYLINNHIFKTKASIRNYFLGQLKYGIVAHGGMLGPEGVEFAEALAEEVGNDYPARIKGKTLRIRNNEFGSGLEFFDEDDPEEVGGISYHKMVTLIDPSEKMLISEGWEYLQYVKVNK